VNSFVHEHRELADALGSQAGQDWVLLSNHEVAALIVTGLDRAESRARALSAARSGGAP
jgi:hypothetical protein